MINEMFGEGQDEIQVIVFQMGLEEYAVPITNVQEIIMVQESTRIPKSPKFVEGVINLRGSIIPVIDGKAKFNLDTDSDKDKSENRTMILEVGEETIGLIVDSVSEVIHINKDNIEPAPINMGDNDFLWGIGKYNERLLILLNPEKILNEIEVSDIQKVTSVIRQSKELAK